MMKRIALCMVGLLAGCSMAPGFTVPDIGLPVGWREPVATRNEAAPKQWWSAFGSAELDSVVALALAQNTSLEASLKRIEQARAQVRVAGASLYPTVGGSAGAGRTLVSNNGDTTGNTGLNAGVNVAYELDLFGANASTRNAARASLQATSMTHTALELVTAADTVTAYTQLLALRERMVLAEKNLALAQDVLALLQVRFNAGAVSGLEVAQQRGSVAGTEATLASLRQQESAARNALAVLTGQAPQAFNVSATSLAGLTAPVVPVNPPALVVVRRPDIRAAEASLEAANANIGAARAAFFPSVNLGAGATWAFDPAQQTLNLSSSLLAPIFQGGALRGNLLLTTARKEELVATYRGTVLTALQEVEDALAQEKAAGARLINLTEAANEARTAYELTRVRLDNGAADMPTLLDTQRSLLSAEDSEVQARLDVLNAATTLIRAMGAGADSP